MMMSFKKPIGMTKQSAYPTQLKWHPHLDKDRVKCQSIAGLVEPQHNNSSRFFIQSLTRMPEDFGAHPLINRSIHGFLMAHENLGRGDYEV